MNVGDEINGFTILWMDNVSERVPDPLVKVGVKQVLEMEEHSYIYSKELESHLTSYTNVHFKRKSELL